MNDSSIDLKKWKVLALFLVAAGAPLFVLFYQTSEQALVAQDASPSIYQGFHQALKSGFTHLWDREYWLGYRYSAIPPDVNTLILKLAQFPISLNLLCSLNLFLGGLGMFFLLRSFRLIPLACIFGGVAFALSSEVLTLVFPGHVNKIMSSAWLPFATMAFIKGLQEDSFAAYAIAGGFLGLSLLGGEVQVPYYLGLWFVVWLFFHLFSRFREGKSVSLLTCAGHGVGLLLLLACCFGVGFSSVVHYLAYLGGHSPVVGDSNPEQNWLFATQFYFPPEEILSYFTTIQFFGAPEVYWGRDGNPTPLRLSDDYVGLLPIGFAIFGGIVCWKFQPVQLFVIMGIGSLLASFGREGLVYWFLYQLPTMKSQRNPHRWSYFVALAICVLAAFGLDWLCRHWNRSGAQDLKAKNLTPRRILFRRFLLSSIIFGTILFIISGCLLQTPSTIAEIRGFDSTTLQSPEAALFIKRVEMALASLTRTGAFLALSAGATWLLIATLQWKSGPSRNFYFASCGFLMLILIFDLGLNAKRYIHFYSWKELLVENALIKFIKRDPDVFRIKAVEPQRHPLLNTLVTHAFPFQQLAVVDPPSVSRLPNDYRQFFEHARSNYLRADRYYDFFNVKYILSATPISDPHVVWTPVFQAHGLFIYQHPNFMPRAWLCQRVRVVKEGSDAVLFTTLHPGFPFREQAVLEEDPTIVPVDSTALGAKPEKGPLPTPRPNNRASIQYQENNVLEIQTASEQAALLVVGEKWDPHWKAWVDGRPAKILKANFLMRAVELPPGKHLVRFEYRPPRTGYYASLISVILFSFFGLGFLYYRMAIRKPHVHSREAL